MGKESGAGYHGGMVFTDPYLETCCRSALHRLHLCGHAGRPAGLKDGPCLARLEAMDLARARQDGRFEITAAGLARHEAEIAQPPRYGVRAPGQLR